jgi:predicted PurR-regulated permease PerM
MVVSCLCTGTLAFIAYSILGISYPLVLALFTGLMVFIPFIGPTIAWILAGLIGLLYSPITALLAAVLTIASQLINDNLIQPRVMGGNVELHPAMILVMIFIGFALGGIFGMICAIPLAAAAKSIFVYYFEKKTGRQLVSEKGALFKGHPSPRTDPAADASDGQLPGKLSKVFSLKKKVVAADHQSEQRENPEEEN